MVKQTLALVGIFLGVLVGSGALTWAQTVMTSVDRNPVHLDETFQLIVKVKGGKPDGSPDLSVLEKDFEVLGTSQRSQTTIINGKMESSTEWVSTLAPKREGTITIPPIPVGSEMSLPLTLTVLPAGEEGKDRPARDVFIDVQVEPSDPYVQSPVHVTVRLYHALPLREGRLEDPNGEDLVVEKLGEDRSFETIVDGRRFGVIERHYAVFPQKSGSLTIPALTFTGQVPDDRRRRSPLDDFLGRKIPGFGSDPFDSLFQSTKPIRTKSNPIPLNVRPIPSSASTDHWLPAQKVELRESWTPDNLDQHELKIGEPLTRTITVVAEGLTGAQLPALPLPENPKFKIYPDQPKRTTQKNGFTTVGILEQKFALVPSEGGTVHLPAIEIPWWDLQSNRRRVARLPARTLQILPDPGAIQSPPPKSLSNRVPDDVLPIDDQEGRAPVAHLVPMEKGVTAWWKWGTGVVFLLWALTLVGWWVDRRNLRHRVGEKKGEREEMVHLSVKEAKRACEQACLMNDPKKAKESLLQWAAQKWAAAPPLGLSGLAQRLSDPEAQAAVWELDRVLYASNPGMWDGRQFWHRIVPAMDKSAKPPLEKREILPPLYVTSPSSP